MKFSIQEITERPPKNFVKFAKELTVLKKTVNAQKNDTTEPKRDKTNLATVSAALAQQNVQPPKKRKIESNELSTQKNNRDIGATSNKNAKRFKKEFSPQSTNISFANVGGIDKILKELCELLLHIKHPEVYKHIGLPPPRGFLLHGPPGCGKTLLAQAIAGV